jgi:hypothetical protein
MMSSAAKCDNNLTPGGLEQNDTSNIWKIDSDLLSQERRKRVEEIWRRDKEEKERLHQAGLLRVWKLFDQRLQIALSTAYDNTLFLRTTPVQVDARDLDQHQITAAIEQLNCAGYHAYLEKGYIFIDVKNQEKQQK